MGIIFVGAFILALFVMWTALIFTLACLGRNRAGFLSGHPFERRHHDGDDDDFWASRVEGNDKRGSKSTSRSSSPPSGRCCGGPGRVRVIFLICNLSVVAFLVLFVTHGMNSIQETAITLNDSNRVREGGMGGRGAIF